MKISKTWLLALLLVASLLVTSSSGWIGWRRRRRRRRTATVTVAPTTAAPYVPVECDRVEDGVCYQYCNAGGCKMECFHSEYYHSCDQSCTSKRFFDLEIWIWILKYRVWISQ